MSWLPAKVFITPLWKKMLLKLLIYFIFQKMYLLFLARGQGMYSIQVVLAEALKSSPASSSPLQADPLDSRSTPCICEHHLLLLRHRGVTRPIPAGKPHDDMPSHSWEQNKNFQVLQARSYTCHLLQRCHQELALEIIAIYSTQLALCPYCPTCISEGVPLL